MADKTKDTPDAEPVDGEPAAEPPRPEWVWMTNRNIAEADGEHPPVRFPNDPGVIEHHQARGWELAEEPQTNLMAEPVAPENAEEPPPPWVELVHPKVEGGTNRVPNNAAALAGAYAAGWELPKPPEPKADEDEPDKPAKRTSKRASAEPADHDKEG